MASGDQLGDGELLLRRFDPANINHFSARDQNSGERHFRSGAFRWDEIEGSTSRGCSVYSEQKLAFHGMDADSILDDKSWGIGRISAMAVRAVERNGVGGVFDAVEDPWPDGRANGSDLRGAAHSLITIQPGVPKQEKWMSKLAMAFEIRDSSN